MVGVVPPLFYAHVPERHLSANMTGHVPELVREVFHERAR